MEYGAASAVAHWTSDGKDLVYVMVTSGEAGIDGVEPGEAATLREREERNSAAVVGVDTVDFLGHTDGVIEYGLPLRRDIARSIRRHKPHVLITQGQALTRRGATLVMADHRWTSLAALDAARDADNRWVFPELLDEGLEPCHDLRMILISGGPEATHFVDVSEVIEKGVASLAEHRAYIAGLEQEVDTSFIRDRARDLGERVGCEYAVGFQLIRL